MKAHILKNKDKSNEDVKKEVEDIEREKTEDMPDLDWENKNFPPCKPYFHYDLSELHGRFRWFCQKAYWGFITTVVYFFFNLLSNVFQFCHKDSNWVRFLFVFITNPIVCVYSFINFYTGYKAVCYDNSLLKRYIILEIPLIIILTTGFILNYINFDGLVYLFYEFRNGHFWVPVFFVIPE